MPIMAWGFILYQEVLENRHCRTACADDVTINSLWGYFLKNSVFREINITLF